MFDDERDYQAEYDAYINGIERDFETYLDEQEAHGREPEEPDYIWTTCRMCHGTGEKPGYEDYQCPECHGEGMAEYADIY